MQKGFDVEALLTGDNLTHLLAVSLQVEGKKQISRIEKASIKKLGGDDVIAGPLALRFAQGDGSTSKMLADESTGVQIDLETLNVIYPKEWQGWVVNLHGIVMH